MGSPVEIFVKTSLRTASRSVLAAIAGTWLIISPTRPTLSQDRPPDNATAARIADGVDKARDGKLLDAVEQFQRVLDTAGDELVPVDRYHHTPARWVVHAHLARLPAEGIRLYRQRVDGQAAKRLEEAKSNRDDIALHRLLADMFAARAAEEAILELARRAFERGEFDAAEHYWRMLRPPAAEDDPHLRFPQPKTLPAAIEARLILVRLFRGERDEAKEELKAFGKKYPDAAGLLAGKTGKYVDTLTELFNQPAKTMLSRLPDQPGWPTFAGSMSRLGNGRTRLPYFWPDVPTWRAPLPLLKSNRSDEASPDPIHPRALAFHPVISGGRAYVADGARVLAIDLMTGKAARAAQPAGGQDTVIPTRQDVRYTLTEADGILYARFGPAALRSTDGGQGGSFILALGSQGHKRRARRPVATRPADCPGLHDTLRGGPGDSSRPTVHWPLAIGRCGSHGGRRVLPPRRPENRTRSRLAADRRQGGKRAERRDALPSLAGDGVGPKRRLLHRRRNGDCA